MIVLIILAITTAMSVAMGSWFLVAVNAVAFSMRLYKLSVEARNDEELDRRELKRAIERAESRS